MIDSVGRYRNKGGIKNDVVIHIAPPADRVATLVDSLFIWLSTSEDHPLIKSCVFHYEFEFIHPFAEASWRDEP